MRMLDRLDTPLAQLNQSFQDLNKEGFALHKSKQQTRFTEAQTAYIKEIFDQGRKSRHAKPQEAERWMQESTVIDEEGNSQPRFEPQEWMTEDQIKHLFSKFAADIRKGKKGKSSKVKPVKEPEVSKETALSDEAKEAEDEENQSYLVAANNLALIDDIMLKVNGDSNEETHSIKVNKSKCTVVLI